MATRVLITDGDQRAALAVVRSLGAAGHELIVTSHVPRPLASASRYVGTTERTPDPLRDPAGFVAAHHTIVVRENVQLLIPTTEAALLAVLSARQTFGKVMVPFPDIATFRRICDKREVLRVAAEIGIDVPRLVAISRASDLESIEQRDLIFPVVLKPARSVNGENGRAVHHGVAYAMSWTDLRTKVRALPPTAFPLLLQQRIAGPGLGIFVLTWDGRLIASFAHRRLREKPPSGGVSVYSESIPTDPLLLRQSRQLLDHFGWQGVAMVEFKRDTATGKTYLMEVNGRFWGSLQLAVDAGVDFPALLVRAALGERVDDMPPYRSGVRNRWWWGDVDQLLTRLRRSREDLDLPGDAPSRLGAIADFFRASATRGRNEIFRWRDPGPFLRESIDWIARRS